jgi:hypothetical protein
MSKLGGNAVFDGVHFSENGIFHGLFHSSSGVQMMGS